MATGKIPLVYMQNSGLGNSINPVLSLVDKQVYNIPLLLMIGWRGEPGVKDEPQHITQGEVTLALLDAIKIPYFILSADEAEAKQQLQNAVAQIKTNNVPHAIVVKAGTFGKYTIKETIETNYELYREDAIKIIVDYLDTSDVIVSTTGKTSRELFEIRAALGHPHHSDFLTVGSMGHSSQIALAIALNKPDRRVFCIDGDGALLMHMGSLALVGNLAPQNYVHIIINNGAHESVGGQPTVGFDIDIPALANANKYKSVVAVSTKAELQKTLKNLDSSMCPALIEIKVKVGSRDNLGRPTIKPVDNKKDFMRNLGV
jgi:phosphonopyruvate decarboxylase